MINSMKWLTTVTAFVMVTHDDALAERCGRKVRLTSGVLG